MPSFFRLASLPALAYVGFASLAYLGQRFIQYRPTRLDREGRGNHEFEPWRAKNGEFLGYVRKKGAESRERVVVVFHGNGGEALNWSWYSQVVVPEVALVLAEYPGYGARPGTPTEGSLFVAAEELLNEVAERWALPITVVGESLGSAVACYVASEKKIDRLALVSPFTSAVDVGAFYFPKLPVELLLKDRYDARAYLCKVSVPLHVVHGTRDKVVPFSLGQKLFESSKSSHKSFTPFEDYGHADICEAIARSEEGQAFRTFLNGLDLMIKETELN